MEHINIQLYSSIVVLVVVQLCLGDVFHEEVSQEKILFAKFKRDLSDASLKDFTTSDHTNSVRDSDEKQSKGLLGPLLGGLGGGQNGAVNNGGAEGSGGNGGGVGGVGGGLLGGVTGIISPLLSSVLGLLSKRRIENEDKEENQIMTSKSDAMKRASFDNGNSRTSESSDLREKESSDGTSSEELMSDSQRNAADDVKPVLEKELTQCDEKVSDDTNDFVDSDDSTLNTRSDRDTSIIDQTLRYRFKRQLGGNGSLVDANVSVLDSGKQSAGDSSKTETKQSRLARFIRDEGSELNGASQESKETKIKLNNYQKSMRMNLVGKDIEENLKSEQVKEGEEMDNLDVFHERRKKMEYMEIIKSEEENSGNEEDDEIGNSGQIETEGKGPGIVMDKKVGEGNDLNAINREPTTKDQKGDKTGSNFEDENTEHQNEKEDGSRFEERYDESITNEKMDDPKNIRDQYVSEKEENKEITDSEMKNDDVVSAMVADMSNEKNTETISKISAVGKIEGFYSKEITDSNLPYSRNMKNKDNSNIETQKHISEHEKGMDIYSISSDMRSKNEKAMDKNYLDNISAEEKIQNGDRREIKENEERAESEDLRSVSVEWKEMGNENRVQTILSKHLAYGSLADDNDKNENEDIRSISVHEQSKEIKIMSNGENSMKSSLITESMKNDDKDLTERVNINSKNEHLEMDNVEDGTKSSVRKTKGMYIEKISNSEILNNKNEEIKKLESTQTGSSEVILERVLHNTEILETENVSSENVASKELGDKNFQAKEDASSTVPDSEEIDKASVTRDQSSDNVETGKIDKVSGTETGENESSKSSMFRDIGSSVDLNSSELSDEKGTHENKDNASEDENAVFNKDFMGGKGSASSSTLMEDVTSDKESSSLKNKPEYTDYDYIKYYLGHESKESEASEGEKYDDSNTAENESMESSIDTDKSNRYRNYIPFPYSLKYNSRNNYRTATPMMFWPNIYRYHPSSLLFRRLPNYPYKRSIPSAATKQLERPFLPRYPASIAGSDLYGSYASAHSSPFFGGGEEEEPISETTGDEDVGEVEER